MKHGCFRCPLVCALASALVACCASAFAQLPTAQLTSVFPPGGKQGASVEVTIAGADLDDAERLVFNAPGIRATPQLAAATGLEPGRPIANRFVVTIAADVAPGTYEARAVGRFGLSNPRSFVVGTLDEITDAAGNATPDKAISVAAGTTINGRIDPSTYDFLRLSLKPDERVLIEVAARRIDSRLDSTLIVLDSSGRELKRIKHGAGADPVLEFTAPAEGTYLLKLYDEVYGGGNDYFYRLSVSSAPFVDFVFPPSGLPGTKGPFTLFGRNLPGGAPAAGLALNGLPLQRLTVEIPLPADEAARTQLALSGSAPPTRAWQDAIEFRLPTPHGPANPVAVHFARAPRIVVEQEPNDQAQAAQRIAVPCEYVGQFYPERDFDWVEFEAKKGQTYWIEVISNQLGLSTDPFFAVFRVTKNDKKQQQSEVAQIDDLPERGRRNPAADDLDPTSDDPAYKFVAPEDGLYRVLVRDQFGDTRQDPSMVYRLVIREPQADFRLLAYPVSPPANQQQQQQTALVAASIRRGGTVAMNIVLQRRDEFDGEVTVSVEGLPPGISCPGAVLGGGVSEGSLVFVAAEDAPAWAGPIRVVGAAKIGDREVRREARYAVVVWGTANRQQQPAEFRLAPGLSLGVVDKELEPALVRIGEDKVYETSLGGTVDIPVKITRRGDFKDPVKLVAVGLTQQMKPKDITLDGSKDEARFELSLNQQNIRPGSYTFFMKGETKRKYTRNPEAVAAAEAEQKRLAEMLKTINDEIKSATEAKNEAALKAAQEKLKAATDLKTQCDKRLDDAKKASQPKDVALALVSTPVKLRIHASPLKLSAGALPSPLKVGAKQALPIKVERLFGFSDTIDLTFSPPSGVAGLTAQNVTLNKGQTAGTLELAAAADAKPGSYPCTVRARARFNNVQVESTATVNVKVE